MSSQVQLNAPPAVRTTAAALPADTYRVSTKHLNYASVLLKTAAFYFAYASNPSEALSGALCGAILRVFVSHSDERPKTSERAYRAQQTASMCLTACASAYAYCTPGRHVIAPFFLGMEASSDGLYRILQGTAG